MKSRKKRAWVMFIFPAMLVIAVLLWQIVSILRADCMVRVSFTGLENMFHLRYEYYAVGKSGSTRVSGNLARLLLGDSIQHQNIYGDLETSYWYGELEYAENGVSFTKKDYLETDFGPNYRVVYDKWTQNSAPLEAGDLDVLRRAAQTLSNGDPENWIWQGGGGRGLIGLMLIRHGDQYIVVKNGKTLLGVSEDETFPILLECPEAGRFDYFSFR